MLILIAIVGIGLLILIHEAGHFLMAKAFGMRAEKFYIGFPPAAVKKQIGETEYGVGFIPLGGYVKISGMTREEDLPEEVVPRAYYAKPVWQRIIVISAGAAMNVILAAALFFAFYWLALPDYKATTTVYNIQAGSGAEAAGMQTGDRLLAVNGVSSDDIEALRNELKSHPDQPASITVDRAGQTITLQARIGRNPDTGEGLLGVVFEAVQSGTHDVPAWEAMKASLSDIGFITKEVFIAIKNLFISEESRKEITSPIGIVAISSQTIEMGWGIYIRVLGFISLQLAIFNLLPLLPLDGGHVVFNLIEKFRGKPMKREVFERVSFVGLALFAALFVMGLFNDVQRLLGPGFNLQP